MRKKKNKKSWPNIYWSEPLKYWVVDGRRYRDGKRTGKLEYFHTRDRAVGRATTLRGSIEDHGHKNGSIAPALRVDAVRAEELLKPLGVNILEAVRFYVEHHEEIDKRAQIKTSAAIEGFLADKFRTYEAGKYAMSSYKAARKRTKHLDKAFGSKSLSLITVGEFESWLKSTPFSPRSMKGVKSVCSEFFKWSIKQGWIQTNPAQFMRISQAIKDVKILTPFECQNLLKAADASPFRERALPYVLLGLFAGLRPSEAEDLLYSNINFETREIQVTSRKLRGEVRYVPMIDGLSERLKPIKWEGALKGSNWRKQWDSVKLMAGFNGKHPFPTDGLRHSFASYWLTIHSDRPKLAEIMGNSVEIIRNHYLKTIPRATAEEFWDLLK